MISSSFIEKDCLDLPVDYRLPEEMAKELSSQSLQPLDISLHSDVDSGELKNGCRVVVKRFRPHQNAPFSYVKMEKSLAGWRKVALQHPNILDFLGLWVHPRTNTLSLVLPRMDYNLIQYTNDNPSADKISLALQIGEALKFIHNQNPPMYHGAIQGSNVLIDGGSARLSDIGTQEVICNSGRLEYEMRWQAPERVLAKRNEEWDGVLCDVWSFGMMIIEMYTRTHPFANYPKDAHVVLAMEKQQIPPRSPGFTDNLWGLLESCWSYTPAKRPVMMTIVSWLSSDRLVPYTG